MSLAKSNARKCAVQALYQWQMSQDSLISIESYFLQEMLIKGAQKSYFKAILHGVPEQLEVIDIALSEFVDRPVEKIDPVERAVLRIGVYELMFRPEVPYKVVINEGVNLAKYYGADGSHKYINGILDKVSQKQRAIEIEAKRASQSP